MSVTFLTNKDKEEIDARISDLEYVPIEIVSFSNNITTKEIGSIIKSVDFSWRLNKEAKSITIGSIVVAPTFNSYTLTGVTLTEDTKWTLKVTDERGLEDSKTTKLTFLNGVYYGVSDSIDEINSKFILTLRKALAISRSKTISVAANEGQYIYYCVPTRFGNCNFNVGGFDGGFELVTTLDFTNSYGYTESYDVYKSTNPSLGSTTIVIS